MRLFLQRRYDECTELIFDEAADSCPWCGTTIVRALIKVRDPESEKETKER